MKTPGLVGHIIADLMGRGLKRAELAEALKVRPSSISGLKAGKGSIDDSKLGTLAKLHGGYTEQELLALKYLEWLENEKGITPELLAKVSAKRHKPNSEGMRAA